MPPTPFEETAFDSAAWRPLSASAAHSKGIGSSVLRSGSFAVVNEKSGSFAVRTANYETLQCSVARLICRSVLQLVCNS